MAERTVMPDKLEAIQPLGACDAAGPDMSRVWMDFRAMKIGGKLYDLMVNHEYKHGIYSICWDVGFLPLLFNYWYNYCSTIYVSGAAPWSSNPRKDQICMYIYVIIYIYA